MTKPAGPDRPSPLRVPDPSAFPSDIDAAALTHGFLFADLRGYTGYLDTHGDRAGAALLARYRVLVRGAVAASHGAEIRTEGDGFYIVFDSVSAAVRCGLAIIEAGAATAAGQDDPIRVGVGVHAGETIETAEGLVGSAVNIAARLCAQARAGELVVSDTVRSLTRTSADVDFVPMGSRHLKGVEEPVAIYRVTPRAPAPGQPRSRAAAGRRRAALLGSLLAITALLVVTVVGAATLLGRSHAPVTPTPGSPAVAVGTPVASPAASPQGHGVPTAPTDAFPNPAEQALLAPLRAIPNGFADTCRRGPYVKESGVKLLGVVAGGGLPAPTASLECSVGASTVLVQRFPDEDAVGGYVTGIVATAICRIPGQCGTFQGGLSMPLHPSVVPIPPGDCSASPNAEGRWAVAGEDRGSIVCYIDGPTGDALLAWTYDRDALLVRARNPRGDAAALYAFFDSYARFIEP